MTSPDLNQDVTPNNDTHDQSSSGTTGSAITDASVLSGIVSTVLTQLQTHTGQNLSHYQSTAATLTPYGMDFWQALGALLGEVQQYRVREAQLQFQANVLQQIKEAVIAIDQEERITYLNAAAAAQYEVDPADVVGQPLSTIYWYEWLQPEDALLAYGMLETQGYWHGENRHIKRNGQVLHVESDVSLLRDPAGNEVGLLACIRDVTTRKQAEVALQSSEARYHQLADAMPQLVWTASEQGIIDYFNIRIHDYEPAVWTGTYGFEWPRLLHSDDLEPTLATWQQAMASKAHYAVEHRVRMADGSWRWHLTRAVWRCEVNQEGRWYGTSTDIHERRQAEEALRQQQQLVQAIVDLSPAIIYIHDLITLRNVFVSPPAAATLGYMPEEFAVFGADLMQTLMHPADQGAIIEHINRLLTAPNGAVLEFEYRMRHKHNGWCWFLTRDTIFQRTVDGKPLRVLGVAIEATSHKVAAEQLRANKARLQLGVQVAGLGIAEVDYTTNLIHLSPEAVALFGLPADTGATPRATVHALFHPADRDEIYRRIHEALDPSGSGWFDMTHRIIRPDGQTRWLHVRKQIFFEPSVDGTVRPVHALLASMDITTNKQAEETLNFHASLLDYAYDAVVATDVAYNITAWNRGAEALYGWSAAEVLGRPVREVTQSSLTPAAHAEVVHQLAEHGRCQLEMTTYHRDGTPLLMESHTVAMRDGTGHLHGYMSISRDIREHKVVEQALRASEAFSRTILESSPDCVKVLDAEGRLLHMNGPGLCLMEIDDFTLLRGQPWETLWPEAVGNLIRSALTTAQHGEQGRFQALCPTSKGTLKWWDVIVAPVKVEGASVTHFVVASRDITKARSIEDALRHATRRFEQAERAAHAFVFESDLRRDLVMRSPNFTQVTGYALDEVAPTVTGWLSLLHPDDLARFHEQDWSVNHLTTYSGEYRIRHKQGHYIWVKEHGLVERNPDGTPVALIGTTLDITAQKMAEEALRRSEERYRVLVQSSSEILWSADAQAGVSQEAALWMEAFTGWHRSPASPTTWWLPAIHPDEQEQVKRLQQQALTQQQPLELEFRLLHHSGDYRYVRLNCVPIHTADGTLLEWFGTLADITERRRAQAQLRASEQRFRQLADAMPQVVWTCQPDGTMTYINDQWSAYSGLTMAATLAQGMWPALHPADLPVNRTQWQQALEQGEPYEGEVRLRRHDGVYRWFLERALPIRDEAGQIQQWFGVSMDITDRKATEEALAVREAFLRAMTDAVPNLMGYIDQHKCYRFVNATYEQWFARPRTAIEGHTMADLLGAEVDTWRHHWQRALAGETVFFEETFTYPDGITRTVMGTYMPDHGADGQVLGFYIYINDITARKQAEADVVARETELRVITDNIPGLVSYIDSAQHYRFVNAAYEDLYQQPRAQLLGQHIRAALSEAAYHQVQPYIERALHGETVQFETTVAYPSGQRAVWATYVPDLDPQGVVRGFYALVTDISGRKAVEEALRQSEETAREHLAELEAIYNTAPIGLCVLDRELRWVRINERLAEINGFSASEHIGRSMRDLLPDLAPTAEPVLQQILESKQPLLNVELHGQTPAQPGVERIWLEHWFPLHAQDGVVVGINIVAEEITDRKRQERHQQFLSELGMNLRLLRDTDAILAKLVSQLGSYLQVAGCRINEIDLANAQFTLQKDWVAVNAPWTPVLTPSVYPLAELAPPAVLADLQAGRTVVIANTLTDPLTVPVSDTYQSEQINSFIGVPIFHQGQWHATVSVKGHGERHWRQDEIHLLETVANQLASLLERVRAEEALRHLNISLEERVRERTVALERTNQALANSNRELEQFNSATAHDLRTPLRGVHNLVQWIVEDAAPVLSPTSQRHLALLQGRVKRLEKMLDDMLAYSQVGRIRHTPEPVDTHALVHSLFELLAPPAGFTIETPVPLPTLVTQRAPLEMILLNLLNNAIKHHHQPAGGQVQVSAQELGTWVEFCISDNGPGIDPAYHKRIFGMFQTLKPRDQVEGSGIGLALVKKILENCGGQIRVESSLGVGTNFRFTWPK